MPANSNPQAEAFTLKQRIALWAISLAGFIAISIIGRTLRFEVTAEAEPVPAAQMPPPAAIAPFWHRCVFAATYYFRRRGIAVMTSRSFDGEYIARIIDRFGFVPVRGSSSRGAVRALLGMRKVLSAGHVAAFTIDGPKGPRYVAKPGPVLLSRTAQQPIYCFYVAHERPWVLKSWDAMMIPRPFSRIHIRWSRPIQVPADADEGQLEAFQAEMQAALERVQRDAITALGAAGC